MAYLISIRIVNHPGKPKYFWAETLEKAIEFTNIYERKSYRPTEISIHARLDEDMPTSPNFDSAKLTHLLDMITYNPNDIPVLRGETSGRSAVVLTEDQLDKVVLNQPSTNLPEGAKVQFLDQLIVKAQKRRETDPDDADKNNFILCSVNGKQRWIGLGTFTRRRYDMEGTPFISPAIANDVPENVSIREFYNKFKDKTLKVEKRIQVKTNVFDAAGNRTEATTTTWYPVLVYDAA